MPPTLPLDFTSDQLAQYQKEDDESWKEAETILRTIGNLSDQEFANLVRRTKLENQNLWARSVWVMSMETELNLRLILAGLDRRKLSNLCEFSS